jgi:small conductance mechanosensitive channel
MALDGSTVIIRVCWWSDPDRTTILHTQGRVIAAVQRALNEAGIGMITSVLAPAPHPRC